MSFRRLRTYLILSMVVAPLACDSDVLLHPPSANVLAATAVASVAVAPDTVTLNAIGDTVFFQATAFDSAGAATGATFEWRSLDTALVTVDSTGMAIAIAPGRTGIQAVALRTGSRNIARANIVVRQIPETASLTPALDTLTADGDTVRLIAEFQDSNGVRIVAPRIIWRSLDTAYASVDSTGLVTARSAGHARIHMSSSRVAARSHIFVRAVQPLIAVADTVVALPGDTFRLPVTVRDSAGNITDTRVTWRSLTDTILSVDINGLITARRFGTGRVRATANGHSAIANVTVGMPGSIGSVTILQADTVLDAWSSTIQLDVRVVDSNGATVDGVVGWTHAGPAVVVTKTGSMTSRRNGTALVIASLLDVADTIEIGVQQRVAAIEAVADDTTVQSLEQRLALSATARDANGNPISRFLPLWTSLDPAVATVYSNYLTPNATALFSRNGLVRFVASFGAVNDTVEIRVEQRASFIRVAAAEPVILLGDTTPVMLEFQDTHRVAISSDEPVSWSSSDTAIATVGVTGVVRAVGTGSATIIASAGPKRDSAVVTVRTARQMAASIVLNRADLTLVVNRSTPTSALVHDFTGLVIQRPGIAWSSTNPAIADVDSTGRVFGVSLGTASIIASMDSAADTIAVVVRARDSRPNIVFILTDDQAFSSWEYMPRMQAEIIGKGTLFPNFIISDPVCCPSRATFLRGQYVTNHQIVSNTPPHGGWPRFVELGHESSTFATWLQSAGYKTAMIGKYLNQYLRFSNDNPVGWDEWFVRIGEPPVSGTPTSDMDDDDGRFSPVSLLYYGYNLLENGTLRRYGNTPSDYHTDVMARQATSFISRMADEGSAFLLYLTPIAPHDPGIPAPRHLGSLSHLRLSGAAVNEADMSDKPVHMQKLASISTDSLAALNQGYQRRQEMLLSIDEAIQAVVDTLTANGLIDNTYIFFTSDNGFHIGEHRLRNGKGLPYETDITTGLAVRGPGVPAGRVASDLLLNNDIAPTLADIAGASVPAFVDGRSFVPSLHRDRATRRAVMSGIWHSPNTPTWQALRTATYSYIEYSNGERELYNILTDPDQLDNIIDSAGPALVSRFANWLARLRTCAGTSCRFVEDTPS